jgi:hypothetical protein
MRCETLLDLYHHDPFVKVFLDMLERRLKANSEMELPVFPLRVIVDEALQIDALTSYAYKATEELTGCKCTFAQSMVGDGCDECNPEYAAEVSEPEEELPPPVIEDVTEERLGELAFPKRKGRKPGSKNKPKGLPFEPRDPGDPE